jgi:carbamoyl-phosphate synthase large subunit
MNIQFAVKDRDVYLIEVNPRASRTVPFVAKAVGVPFARIAARVMAGEPLSDFRIDTGRPSYTAVKEAVFPFARFPGADPVLSPEMKSTGEVMGVDADFALAFWKSQLGAGTVLPTSGTVFVSVKDTDKPLILPAVRDLLNMGFQILATRGTARFLEDEGLAVEVINKVLEGQPHIVDRILDGAVHLVFNTTEGAQSLKDSQAIRSAAWSQKVPIYTTASASLASVEAIAAIREREVSVTPLQTLHANR